MGKFFSFDKMITPIIIKLFFWLGVLGIILFGISSIVFGAIAKSGGWIQIVIGIVCLFLGPIFIRIYCEMLIVFFKVQESLIQIRDFLFEQKKVNNTTSESN